MSGTPPRNGSPGPRSAGVGGGIPHSPLSAFLQSELTTLAGEARKVRGAGAHGDQIKESAERALVALRTVLASSSHPLPAHSSSHGPAADPLASLVMPVAGQLLVPLLHSLKLARLGANSHKLVSTAMSAVHRMIGFGAVPPAAVSEALKEVEDCLAAGPPMDIQLKALQVAGGAIGCLGPVVVDIAAPVDPSEPRDMPGEPIAVRTALQIANALHTPSTSAPLYSAHGGPIISNTAAATMRQIISASFERAHACLDTISEDDRAGLASYPTMPPPLQTAYALFHDLCLLTGDPSNPTLLLLSPTGMAGLSKPFGLELIDSCLTPSSLPLFHNLPVFLAVFKTHLLPLLIRTFSDGATEFDLLIRLVRCVESVVRGFASRRECAVEIEILVSVLEKLASDAAGHSGQGGQTALSSQGAPAPPPPAHPAWIHAPALEFFGRVLASSTAKDLFQLDTGPEMVGGVLSAAGKLAVGRSEEPWGSGIAVRVPCLDQLDKIDPPNIPDSYLPVLAFRILTGASNEFSSLAMLVDAEDPQLHREMLALAAPALLPAFTFLISSPLDDSLYTQLLSSFSAVSVALARVGLAEEREAWLAALGHAALPSSDHVSSSNVSSASSLSSTGSLVGTVVGTLSSLSGASVPQPTRSSQPGLSERNLACLRTLITTSSALSGSMDMDSRAWVPLLGALQAADQLLYTGKLGGRLQVDGPGLARKPTQQFGTYSPAAEAATAKSAQAVDSALAAVRAALTGLFEGTANWEIGAVLVLVGGLGQLAEEGKTGAWEAAAWAIARIREVILANLPRIVSERGLWNASMGIIVGVAWSPACPPGVRAQACQAFGDAMSSAVHSADLAEPAVENRIMDALKEFMGLGGGGKPDRNAPFYSDVVRSGLDTLNKMLQREGQSFSRGWPKIFDVVRSVVEGVNANAAALGRKRIGAGFEVDERYLVVAGTEEAAQITMATAATANKQVGVIRAAFPSVQLICTDFLPVLDLNCLSACVDAVACFGAQNEDLNVTLSAIGLTWTVSDHIMTLRTAAKDGDESALALDVEKLNELWRNLLEQLSDLCTDPRPEVRHAANQTLFRTVTLQGGHLSEDVWEEVIWNVLFPLLEKVRVVGDKVALAAERAAAEKEKAGGSGGPKFASSGFILHHSRNTISKQWDETRALTLSGVGRCFREHLDVLVSMEPGRFEKVWALFFEYAKDWALGYSQEVSLGAMKTLKTVLGFPQEEAEISEQVRNKLIPFWTTAWEEWASIGEGIIIRGSGAAAAGENGSAPPSEKGDADSSKDFEHVFELAEDGLPKEMSGDFTQETIGMFVSSFQDVYPTIRHLFSGDNFKRLMRIVDHLLVYTTIVEPGSKYSKTVWDLDVLSPLQDAVLKILAGLDATQEGLSETIMAELAMYVKLPIRRGFASPTRRHSGSKATLGKGIPQGPTFVAFSARAMDAAWEIYERRKDSPTLYDDGVLVELMSSHAELMRYKYDCPSPGNKPSDVPLWKSAATSFLRLIGLALPALHDLESQVSPQGTAAVFQAVIDGLGAFLLSPSSPPPEATDAQLAADEEFDISVLRSIEADIVPHLGMPNVPEALVLHLVDMLRKGSNLYLGTETLHGAMPVTPSLPNVNGASPQPAAASAEVVGAKPAKVNVLHIPVHREKFANECLDLMFRLCSDTLEDNTEARKRVAEIVAPALLERCSTVISNYVADKGAKQHSRSAGRHSSESNYQELVRVLGKLVEVQLRPNVLQIPESSNPVKNLILSGPSAHLFFLYLPICECLSADGATTKEDKEVEVMVKKALKRMGMDMGLV